MTHELMVKWSNPARYRLTDKGRQLAARVLTTEGREEEVEQDGSFGGREEPVDRREELKEQDDENETDLQRALELSKQETFGADFSLGADFSFGDQDSPPSKSNKVAPASDSARVSSASSAVPGSSRTSCSVPGPSRGGSSNAGPSSLAPLPLPLALHKLARQAQAASRPQDDRYKAQFTLGRGNFEVILILLLLHLLHLGPTSKCA